MAAIIAVIPFQTPTSVGTLDITDSGQLGGETPKAALFFMTNNITLDTEAAGVSITSGLAGDSQQALSGVRFIDNATSGVSRRATNDSCVGVLGPGGTAWTVEGAFDSFITDGIRINFTKVSASQFRGFVILFAGADVDVDVVSTTSLNSSTPLDINTLSFAPDLVFHFYSDAHTDSNSNGGLWNFGIATRVGPNHANYATSATNSGGIQPYARIGNDALQVLPELDGDPFSRVITAGSWDSQGATMTTTQSTINQTFFMFLRLGNTEFALVDFDTPTSTGVDATISGLGFEPDFAMGILTSLESRNQAAPLSLGNNNAGLTAFAFNATDQAAAGWRRDNVSPSDTGATFSVTDTVFLASDTAAKDVVATLDSFDADGINLNFSDVATNPKMGFMLVTGPSATVDPFDHVATQAFVESLHTETPEHDVTRTFLEALYQQAPTTTTTQAFVEVLRSVEYVRPKVVFQNSIQTIDSDPELDAELEDPLDE